MNSLLMKDHHVAIGSFDRKNLFYGVKSFSRSSQFVDQLVEEISKYVDNANSTIVYCTTVKDTEEVTFHLCHVKTMISVLPTWDILSILV